MGGSCQCVIPERIRTQLPLCVLSSAGCCCCCSIGVALPYTMQGERHRNTIFLFRAFAAGVVLSVAFVHILPGELRSLVDLVFQSRCSIAVLSISWDSSMAIIHPLLWQGLRLLGGAKEAAIARGAMTFWKLSNHMLAVFVSQTSS